MMWTTLYLQVLTAMTLSGYAGSHYTEGGWQLQRISYGVALASLGVKAEPNDWASTSVRFLYFDLLRGSDSTSIYHPYLQEAWVQGRFTPSFSLRIGHQIFSYRDGLFLHDNGDGSDAIRLRWGEVEEGTPGLDLFLLRKGSQLFETHTNLDRDLLGFYTTLNFNTQILDLYGAYGNYSRWPIWIGTRADLRFSPRLLTVFEGILNWQHHRNLEFAFQSYVRYLNLWATGTILGLGVYGFSKNWQKPVSYPLILDSYYNGWTSFGEAMNWVVLPIALGPYLSSSSVMDPYAIYWPDLHNLWVTNAYYYLPFSQAFSLRVDYWVFRFDDPPIGTGNSPEIGQEFTLNLYYQRGLTTLGLATGLFFPLSATKMLGLDRPAWNLRLWGFVPFQVQIPEGMK